ncbi:disks large-like 5-like [Sigmodon hispidus]
MSYHRMGFDLEMLNMEHKKVMLDLQKFTKEINEALYECKELTEETVSCRSENFQHDLEQATTQGESFL